MGYVYKTTNLINSKWYIGSHNGKKPNYMGSGLLLGKAIKKYGKENFIKEILYEGEDYIQQEEQILISLDAMNDELSYNMKNQALGGIFPGKLNGMYGKKLSKEQRHKCGNAFRGKSRPHHSKIMSGNNNPMYGKSDHAHGLINRMQQISGKTYEEFFGEDKAKEFKQKLSAAQSGKKHNLKFKICPHCNTEGSGPNMTRYHFDNCKKVK